MKKILLMIIIFVLNALLVSSATTTGNLTWINQSFHVYQSSSLTFGAGTLICSLTLTDTDDEVIACSGGSITDLTDYCLEYNISQEVEIDKENKWKWTNVEDSSLGYFNIVGVMGSGNIFGSGAVVDDCDFYDYGSDNRDANTNCTPYIHSTQTDTIQFRVMGIGGNEEMKIKSASVIVDEGIRVCLTSGTGTTNDSSNYLYTLENKGGDIERSNNITFTAGIYVPDENVYVTLNEPENDLITDITSITFDCSATSDFNLTNISLYHNASGSFSLIETKTLTGTSDGETFVDDIGYTNIVWNCEAYNNISNTSFADNNFTLTTKEILTSISDASFIYRFEEGTGTNASDTSLNENHGTIFEAIYTGSKGTNATGLYTLNFDGIDDYVSIVDDDALDLTANLTYSAWINSDVSNPTTNEKLLYKTDFYLERVSGTNTIRCNVADDIPISTTNVFDGTWHLVTCINRVEEGISNTSIFIDGIMEDSVAGTQGLDITNTDTMYIGSQNGSGLFYNGSIDEVIGLNYVMTPQEIINYFNKGLEGYEPITMLPIPTVELISPAHDTTTEDVLVTLECLSTDAEKLENVTLYHNISGTFTANETQYIATNESTNYFNITVPMQTSFEWNCEAYNNNSQSAFADSNYVLNVFTDMTNPVLSLISPQNNTINNTFPLNITFTATDDGSNDLTCILRNSTYTFDDRTASQGTYYLTLKIGNETELSQNFPDLEIECFDNTLMNNSAVLNLNLTIDKVLPLMIILSPELNATFNKAGTESISIHTTCFDDNVYRLNVTISNSSDIIFSEQDMTPVANTLEINSALDISALSTGIYQKSDYCADSHTKKAIPNYNTIKIAGNGIRWTTPSGNEFELKCYYAEGILDYGFYKSANDDRYVFYYILDEEEDGSTFDIECELENRKFSVAYLSNSPYPAHFIMENNWMDFVLENDDEAEHEVSLNENDNYVIEISTTTTNLTFNSVGELNTIEVLSTITITYELPREDEYVLGTCPVDTLPRAMLFMFFILLAFLIMGIGFVLKNGLIGTIGSIFLISTGVYLWFCLAFASLILMALGVIMMSMFVFKGMKAFN